MNPIKKLFKNILFILIMIIFFFLITLLYESIIFEMMKQNLISFFITLAIVGGSSWAIFNFLTTMILAYTTRFTNSDTLRVIVVIILSVLVCIVLINTIWNVFIEFNWKRITKGIFMTFIVLELAISLISSSFMNSSEN